MARLDGRRGLVTPLVILTLLVTCTLAMAVISSSQTDYLQAVLVGHGMRARELSLAVMEEARAAVYLQVQAEGAPWKTEIIEQCRKQANDLTSPLPPENQEIFAADLGADLLPESTRLVEEARGEIRQARVTFLGFRRIGYAPDGMFLREKSYYTGHKDAGLDEEGALRAPEDWIGYYRLDVTVGFGRGERRISELHDVKIVSVAPPAPEFGVFSWLENRDDDYRKEGLIGGGGFYLFPGGKARAYVRGPFNVASYGRPDGSGGRTVPEATASLRPSDWWGWQLVPGPRDGVIPRENLLGLPLDAPAPGRPLLNKAQTVIPPLADILFGMFIDRDPGYLLEEGTQFICETKVRDDRDRPFSLFGDPQASFDFEVPRGMVVRPGEGGKLEVMGSSDDLTGGNSTLGNETTPTANEEDRYSLVTEGNLLMECKIATVHSKVTKPEIPVFGDLLGDVLPGWGEYFVTLSEVKTFPYGLHHEHCRKASLITAIAKSLKFFLGVAAALSGLGVLDLGLIGADGALDPAAQAALDAITKLEEQTRPDREQPPNPGELTSTAGVEKVYPPRWRPAGRAVTRRYAKLANVLAKTDGKLKLDGVLGFGEARTADLLEYEGRGVLYTADAEAKLPAMVQPARNHLTEGGPWLTIHHDGTAEAAKDGKEMLEFEPLRNPDDVVTASVYATQGVKTSGELHIDGNLVCGFVNKMHLPRGSRVEVRYPIEALHKPSARFDDHAWRVVAVSHRVCQSIEW